MVKCTICGHDANHILTIDKLYGKTNALLVLYLCDSCVWDLEDAIDNIVKDLKG